MIDGLRIELSADRRLLVVDLGSEHAVVSWALVNGGLTRAPAAVWRYVDEHELGPDADAEALLRRSLATVSLPDAVGLLTSRALDTYTDRRRTFGGITARCIATVGLTNALRAGDRPAEDGGDGTSATAGGTINVLCHVSAPLREEAMLEALSVAAEARTAAVMGSGVRSRQSGDIATGTGTDCIVIAAPIGGSTVRFAGKHTVVGHVVGAAVADAVAEGVERWQRECR